MADGGPVMAFRFVSSRFITPHRVADVPCTLEGDAKTWEQSGPNLTLG